MAPITIIIKRTVGVIVVAGAFIFLGIGISEARVFLLDKFQAEYFRESYPNWRDENVIIFLGVSAEVFGP